MSTVLYRWPTEAEVRQHFVTEGLSFAVAIVTGFRDMAPTAARFTALKGGVRVEMLRGPNGFVDTLPSGSGLAVRFLTTIRDASPEKNFRPGSTADVLAPPTEEILSPDVVAAMRLPIALPRFDQILAAYKDEPGLQCTKRGDWFVLLRPNPDTQL